MSKKKTVRPLKAGDSKLLTAWRVQLDSLDKFTVDKFTAAGLVRTDAAIPMLLWCPECGARHVDAGEFATKLHHTHACQTCGHVWRPALIHTVGVQFLPGFKDKP